MRALYQAATYLVATEGSGQIQKSFAKMYAVVWAVNWAIALVCRMPWTGGGPIISVRPPFLPPTPSLTASPLPLAPHSMTFHLH